MDKEGQWRLSPTFAQAYPFMDGLACVMLSREPDLPYLGYDYPGDIYRQKVTETGAETPRPVTWAYIDHSGRIVWQGKTGAAGMFMGFRGME